MRPLTNSFTISCVCVCKLNSFHTSIKWAGVVWMIILRVIKVNNYYTDLM